MKNNQEKILIFLAFLPIILFPISLPFSLILATGLYIYAINTVQDRTALKKILTPLTLLLLIGVTLGMVNIFFSIIDGIGTFSPRYAWSAFKAVLGIIHHLFELILSVVLYVFSILFLVSLRKNKPVILLSGLVDKIVNNDYSFKRKNKPTAKKNVDADLSEKEVVKDEKQTENEVVEAEKKEDKKEEDN